MQEKLEVIKSNIYLPPEDDYEMDVADDKEDEAMKEMLAKIESAKGYTMRIILKNKKVMSFLKKKIKTKHTLVEKMHKSTSA